MAAAECSTKPVDLPEEAVCCRNDLSGSTAGKYRLVSRIGTRGAADIYLGRHNGSGTVAIKVVDTLSAPAQAVRLFNEERALIGRFDHPNLARMLDEGTTSTGALYLAMQFVDGLPVNDFIKQWSLTGPAAIEIFLQICCAIEYLHSVGFAHNGLEAENILVRTGPHAMVVDFASTAEIASQNRRAGRLSDVYYLGLLLRGSMAGISWPELDRVICKATRSAAAERFPTVCDLAQRLQRLL
jgi:serine/threonine protein kinase